jgi:hypothetical protein
MNTFGAVTQIKYHHALEKFLVKSTVNSANVCST